LCVAVPGAIPRGKVGAAPAFRLSDGPLLCPARGGAEPATAFRARSAFHVGPEHGGRPASGPGRRFATPRRNSLGDAVSAGCPDCLHVAFSVRRHLAGYLHRDGVRARTRVALRGSATDGRGTATLVSGGGADATRRDGSSGAWRLQADRLCREVFRP